MTFALPAIRGVLQGTQDFMSLAISTSIEAILRFALAVSFAFAGWGVSGIFLGYVLAGVVSFVYTIVAVRKHFGGASVHLTIDLRRLWQSTGGIVVGTSAITLLTFIDLPLVKHFFEPAQAGIYGAVTICGKMLFFAIGFIPTLVLPKAAGRAAKGETVQLEGPPKIVQGGVARRDEVGERKLDGGTASDGGRVASRPVGRGGP